MANATLPCTILPMPQVEGRKVHDTDGDIWEQYPIAFNDGYVNQVLFVWARSQADADHRLQCIKDNGVVLPKWQPLPYVKLNPNA